MQAAESTHQPLSATTDLERKLALVICFLYTVLVNAALRMFVWPRIPAEGLPLLCVVIGTRVALGLPSLRMYQSLTKNRPVDYHMQVLIWLLPTALIDTLLGSCYGRCAANTLTAGFCRAL